MDDLQAQLNRRVVALLEELSGSTPQAKALQELRDLLLTMELSAKLKPAKRAGIDWWRFAPLLLTLSLILAAIVAALLGVDIGRLL